MGGEGDFGLSVTSARILHRLRRASDWRRDIDDSIADLARSLNVQRAILFELRELPEQGFAQSIASYWVDDSIKGIAVPPTLIIQSLVSADPLLSRIAEEMRQGKPFIGHTRELSGFLRRDFERQQIKSFLSVVVFANGNPWGTLAINDCVAEREWTEGEKAVMGIAALAIGDAIERSVTNAHVSEVIRAALLQASLDAVVIMDEAGSIIEFNPAAERMFGWTRDQIIGKDVLDTLIPESFRPGYANGGDYMAGRGAPMIGRRIETLSRNAAGEEFPIELTVAEVRTADRHLFLGSIRDLREKRRAEEEINRQREKLHQNEKMAAMGSLLAGVSHELNNPLAVVVAQSTLLHEFASDAGVRARAEKVRAAAERCGRIVRSFLGMVRPHATAHAETDLNAAVRAALEVTAYGARSSGISIDAEFAPGALLVMADADHITQVVANFLVNSQHALAARQYARRITVRTFRNHGRNGFSVEDNGPGIPEAIRHRIFESYFTTKPVGVGTGIGLSISKSIVERHKGRVWFEPVVGGGARFVAELPAADGQGVQGVQSLEDHSALRHALIIDDEPDVATSLADILELMGVKARIVTAAPADVGALAAGDIDIVFCDLRMPGTSGMDLYRQLLQARSGLTRRFVLVSGDMIGARAEIEMLAPHQRPQILEKPFSMLDIRGLLAAITDQVSLAG